jgi:hypothetical protein
MRHSDSGSHNGQKQRQQRESSIIDRNKAKLVEIAEKKKAELDVKEAEQIKRD